MILFEYPFNERVRALMRLEYLFDRLTFFAQPGDARLHQVALAALFDLLDATERADMKSSVLQDLDRQRVALLALQDHPGVDTNALQHTLSQMDSVTSNLIATGKTGQTLRDNDWLTSLRGRLAVPGGGTQVDMPSFHAWQCRDVDARCADLQKWIEPLEPLKEGIAMVLGMLRESTQPNAVVGSQGGFQQMLGGKVYQLLRVWVSDNEQIFPEISANKYMVWIRFATQDGELRPQAVAQDVSFKMALCSL
ncbi:cell division protein ZapD [Jezberella montanilacus]|uniref:Cell division protein ZapD n=1 Tax=Jezberella montanilacus TaxID=323426 RepID=A0A2T0XCX0_9BURK|nr:cell division protein ZapD [Jezberella montanilacus]PRY96771.1 cell division protein ZapD [Jezberella montanilacus]